MLKKVNTIPKLNKNFFIFILENARCAFFCIKIVKKGKEKKKNTSMDLIYAEKEPEIRSLLYSAHIRSSLVFVLMDV